MNERYFFNIFLVLFSSILYATGLLHLLLKILVKNGLYIFNYHSFNTLENDYWKFGSLFSSNYQKNFAKQVQFFERYMNPIPNFRLDSVPLDKPNYMLTFDDGYKDNYQVAFPVLKRFSVPAIFFVATKPIGTETILWYDAVRYFYETKYLEEGSRPVLIKKELKSMLIKLKKMGRAEREDRIKKMEKKSKKHQALMMDWSEIQKAHAGGIQIGSHSHSHPILTHLDRDGQIKEIQTSLEMIREKVNVKTQMFSYPEGDEGSFNQDTIQILKSSGIRYAFTTTNGVNHDMESPFNLKRVGIKASDTIPVTALRIIRASLYNKGSAEPGQEVSA